jgi:serine/threonine protein kinase
MLTRNSIRRLSRTFFCPDWLNWLFSKTRFLFRYSLLSGKAPFEGCCGNDCEWAEGGSCDDCMDLLFSNIQKGQLRFPENRWKRISNDAINLISRCLANDPSKRPSPEQILKHQWFNSTEFFAQSECVKSSKVRTSSSAPTTIPYDEIMIFH